MCYRCEVCLEVSKPRQQMLRHVVTRPRPVTPWNQVPGTEVAREVPVCPTCHRDLTVGPVANGRYPMTLADLMAAHAFTRVDRLEREQSARAVKKNAEREMLRQAQLPLFQTVKERRATEKKGKQTPLPAKIEPAGLVELEPLTYDLT